MRIPYKSIFETKLGHKDLNLVYFENIEKQAKVIAKKILPYLKQKPKTKTYWHTQLGKFFNVDVSVSFYDGWGSFAQTNKINIDLTNVENIEDLINLVGHEYIHATNEFSDSESSFDLSPWNVEREKISYSYELWRFIKSGKTIDDFWNHYKSQKGVENPPKSFIKSINDFFQTFSDKPSYKESYVSDDFWFDGKQLHELNKHKHQTHSQWITHNIEVPATTWEVKGKERYNPEKFVFNESLKEFTIHDFRNQMSSIIKRTYKTRRSLQTMHTASVVADYDFDKGILYFIVEPTPKETETVSSDLKGNLSKDSAYTTAVQFMEIHKWVDDWSTLKLPEFRQILDVVDVKFSCNCAFFHFGGVRYQLTQLDSAINPLSIPDPVWHARNENKVTLCKHCLEVTRKLKFEAPSILNQIRKRL